MKSDSSLYSLQPCSTLFTTICRILLGNGCSSPRSLDSGDRGKKYLEVDLCARVHENLEVWALILPSFDELNSFLSRLSHHLRSSIPYFRLFNIFVHFLLLIPYHCLLVLMPHHLPRLK